MEDKLGACSRNFLIIINCVFIVFGLIVLAIGAWVIETENSVSFGKHSEVIGGAAILIITGGVTMIIPVIGLLGAIYKNRILLGIYALVVLIVVILEIIAGIVGFVYRNQTLDVIQIQNELSPELIGKYNFTDPNDNATILVNRFQNVFQCCGANNATDWTRHNPRAIHENGDQPPGCPPCYTSSNCADYFYEFFVDGGIKTEVFNTTTIGCLSVDTQALLGPTIPIAVVGIIFGPLEITGIVAALLLFYSIHQSQPEQKQPEQNQPEQKQPEQNQPEQNQEEV